MYIQKDLFGNKVIDIWHTQNEENKMRNIDELRKATGKVELVGKVLIAISEPRQVSTMFGTKNIYTVKDEQDNVYDFFGGAGLDKQELKTGDKFKLVTKDTGKGNEMYYAVSA